MDTIDLPASARPNDLGQTRRVLRSTPSSAAALADTVSTETIGGLRWTHRGAFDRALRSLPIGVWSDPASAGWTCVKRNTLRRVWRAEILSLAYYVKYYRCSSRTERLKSLIRGSASRGEWNGMMYALRHGIPAVRAVGFCERADVDGKAHSILVTEAVEPSYLLCDHWSLLCRDDDRQRRRRDCAALIDMVAEMIARAHQAGFEHLDMHAANILVQPTGGGRYRTLFVDLQTARVDAPLAPHAVVRNLSQLNQWFRRHSSVGDRLRFLRAYWRWRNEYEGEFPHARPVGMTFDELLRELGRHSGSHADRLWAQRDRRVGRDGRYFARLKLGGGWRARVVVESKRRVGDRAAAEPPLQRPWWKAQLADPLRWFADSRSTAVKLSHSGSIARALLPTDERDVPVIIKRPIARNWRRALRLVLPPSRSARAWKLGHALLHRDIPTPRPLALLERRIGPLVVDSMLLTEAIPGGADLDAFLRARFAESTPREWDSLKRRLTELLVRELRNLFDRGFSHRDCKAQNILLVAEPELRAYFVDLDGVRFGRRGDESRALLRLYVSLRDVPGITRSDLVRFLRAYGARFGAPHRAWRELWRRIALGLDSKLRAKERRRAWKIKQYGRE